MKSVYVTNSSIVKEGHGGGVVSYHELSALKKASQPDDPRIFQRIGNRAVYLEDVYPQNPFMFDYFLASLLTEPESVGLAQFYGSGYPLMMKRLSKARKFATVPAHNLELSLEEWRKLGYWGTPPAHLTDDTLFRFLNSGLSDVQVISPSTPSARYLKRKLGLDSVIIPHGTDIPSRFNIDRSDFKVFHLSQFGPDKGQLYLLQAWKKFNKGRLMMCCNNIIDGIIQGVPNLSVSTFTSEAEKEELYLNASVYVQPSVTEGWGLEVGEAMSYGVPVIVTEGVGAADMVVNGRDGFVVPIRDPDAIVDKLSYFHDNPMEVRRMGHNARITAEQFSWDKIEERYVKLFSQ